MVIGDSIPLANAHNKRFLFNLGPSDTEDLPIIFVLLDNVVCVEISPICTCPRSCFLMDPCPFTCQSRISGTCSSMCTTVSCLGKLAFLPMIRKDFLVLTMIALVKSVYIIPFILDRCVNLTANRIE